MKAKKMINLRRAAAAALSSLFFLAGVSSVAAHGGEDHGDEKPKTATTDKGTVTRSMRLGSYEITFKHPALAPDQAASGKIFVTKFDTNEAATEATPAVEIEAANGAVSEAAVEKTDAAGSFAVKMPALAEGVYAIRVKLTYAGETDTATFSGVEVSSEAAGNAAGGASSWISTVLLFLLAAIILGAFAGLFYLVWKTAGGERVGGGESVSA
jgi:hypothetical protein